MAHKQDPIYLSNEERAEEVNEWIHFGMRLGVSSALHPFEYAKTMIQIGFEPITPRPGKSFFGRPVLVLPNIFQYIAYIKSVDGLKGCYRGLSPKLVGCVLSTHISEKLADKLGLARVEPSKDDNQSEDVLYSEFEQELKRDIVVHAAGVIISHPFHVISVRMMAQFVGRETKYDSIFGSIVQIYKDEGISGFFSGMVPRFLFDVSCVIVTSTATYYLSKHLVKDRDMKGYLKNFSSFVCTSVFYPLQLVSTLMTVSGSGLKAGTLPMMPIYQNWRHCYTMLKIDGEHKRGSSLFARYLRSNKLSFERRY